MSQMHSRNSYSSLVKGIQYFDVTGGFNPCKLLLTGDQAFPVLVSTKGNVLIAASWYGAGRMVVTAHEAMLQMPQFLPFIRNSLEWLKPSPTAEVGVHRNMATLSDLLLRNSVQVHPNARLGDSFGVYCINAYDDTQAGSLAQFVERGGGLLIGGQAWHWSYQHGKEKVLAEFPGNRVIGMAGVYFTAAVGDNGVFPVQQDIPEVPPSPEYTCRPAFPTVQTESRKSYESLVKGIESLAVTGEFNPCELLLTGNQAFPVLVSPNGQVLIAASWYGAGRMVVTAHESMLKMPQFLPFIRNSLEWLKPSSTAQIGVHKRLDALSELLLSSGVKVHPDARLGDSLGVYCIDAYDATQADGLVQFVKRGGGLLIGGQAWYWSYQHGKGKVLAEFPGNWVTSVSGVYFTANMGENGIFPVQEKMPKIPLITQHGLDIEGDLKTLLNGVTTFCFKGMIPSELLIHGNLAFPVGITDSFQCFAGAAHYGRGRVVVFSHEGMLNRQSMKTFLLNAINWVTAGKGGKVGVGDQLKELYSMLNQAGVPCELTDLKPGLSVYCCNAYSDQEKERIHEFVSEGGGLLIGGQAWYWTYQNPTACAIAQYPGNKILKKFGIGITGECINLPGESYPARQAGAVASSYHFRKALFQFKEHIQSKQALQPPYSSWLKKLGKDCATFLSIPATDSPPLSSVHEDMLQLIKLEFFQPELTRTQRIMEASMLSSSTSSSRNLLCGISGVRASNPIKSNSDEAILIQMAFLLYNNLPRFQDLVPHLIQNLPSYPTAPPQVIQINGINEGDEAWRSTGLYVPPAKTVSLLFPPNAISAQLQVQIGCHSDDLSNAENLLRPPVVIRRFKVTSERMEVSSLWGGLLYIVLPKKSSVGTISVTVEGASLAPYFKHGETSLSAWKDTIRHYPAPWAELETENIILTVASEDVRGMDNPGVLLNAWAQMMRAVAKLAAIPPFFPRPERIVEDVQISVGGMHSGYPIMANVAASEEITDVQRMYTKGTWGPIHELGHNQQKGGWEFPPHTTEATCNLWSVYVNETVLNIPREIAHPELKPDSRKRRVKDYIQGGARLKDFMVWTALEPYLQLQEAFGWEPYIHIFAKYQAITHIPTDNSSKMNLWTRHFSQEVSKNLGPFFKAWGWPIEENLTQELARSFPPWTEDPMKKYESS
ncbi:TRPM8 channel-associated factor homolog [Podarcis raffonei]|uniref:TRPM8 channel-associated factor homolog n=1 Tax=Podarcis raffonei TaxID=65483 RepID=UPI0023298B62|nr:TRPM8 channel-associated factor homolog [Podarcis raffonei]XP_053263148.1 TRPM8 channel-associated factor homolog [Podarcis raffonei]